MTPINVAIPQNTTSAQVHQPDLRQNTKLICENLRIISQFAFERAINFKIIEKRLSGAITHTIQKKTTLEKCWDTFFVDKALHREKIKHILIQTIQDLQRADRSLFVKPNREYTELFCAAQKFNQTMLASKMCKKGFFTELGLFHLIDNALVEELQPLLPGSVSQTSLANIPDLQKPFVRKEGFFIKYNAIYYDQEDASINHYTEGFRIFIGTQYERILSLVGRTLERIVQIFGQNKSFFSHHHYFLHKENAQPEKIYRLDSPIVDDDSPTSYWIGHATCLMKIPKTTSSGKKISINLITDPVEGDLNTIFYPRMTRPGLTVKEWPAIHVFLLSHNHLDHYDHSTIKKLLAQQPIMLVPSGDAGKLKSLGFKNIYEQDWWQEITIPLQQGENTITLKITGVPAHHWSGQGIELCPHTSGFLGYVIHTEKGDIYFAGDTARLSEEHVATLRNRFNIVSLFQPGGPDEQRKEMLSTHQSSVDALSMHFKIMVKKLYESHPTLNKWQFIKNAKDLRTLFMHTKTYKLGNLHFDDTERSVNAVLAALGAHPEQLSSQLAKLQIYEKQVYDELIALGKEMRFANEVLDPVDIHEILTAGVCIPMIGQRSVLCHL
jgi:L-ascorbate metabolism protein UlaG (beta-lactamase superfamily)